MPSKEDTTTVKAFVDVHGGYDKLKGFRLTNGNHIWRLEKAGGDYYRG